ncbi:hypothetical protein MY3296_000253 [Beauveria thailandica]
MAFALGSLGWLAPFEMSFGCTSLLY